MSAISRGAKNAFRSPVRTVSVTVILAISIGLALVMLLSMQAVQQRIDSVKGSIGATITVSPAGSRGFEGGGEPLHTSDVQAVASLADVASTYSTLEARVRTDTDTNLQSSIDAGTLGQRFNREGGSSEGSDSGSAAAPDGGSFTLPLTVTGTSDVSAIQALGASGTSITSGSAFSAGSSDDVAMVGKALADKNSLAVGSTFTLYGTTFTVKGIYDTGNEFGNGGLYVPIKSLQTVADEADQVSSITVSASSIDTVDSVVSEIKDKLGTGTADVTSSQDRSADAIAPLENIKSISLYSLIGSLVAGAVITFLIMMMVVRERRKEIGVLKAIGASNFLIVTQFISESMVFTLAGCLLGTILGALLSNPVLSALVSSSDTSSASTGFGGPGGGGFQGAGRVAARFGGAAATNAREALTNLQASVGVDILLYGLATALVIGILGSAIPAWLIAKVRPAEVMRSE